MVVHLEDGWLHTTTHHHMWSLVDIHEILLIFPDGDASARLMACSPNTLQAKHGFDEKHPVAQEVGVPGETQLPSTARGFLPHVLPWTRAFFWSGVHQGKNWLLKVLKAVLVHHGIRLDDRHRWSISWRKLCDRLSFGKVSSIWFDLDLVGILQVAPWLRLQKGIS